MHQAAHSPTADSKRRVRAEPPTTVDVAIIGCGLGALQAGAELASSGMKVALFDPHYVAGGCATQFARGGAAHRWCFDVGLHYIGDCGEDGCIPRLLRRVGIEQQFASLDEDGFDTIVFPDLTFRYPVGFELLRERLLAVFPGERRGIDRYLRVVQEVGHIGETVERNEGKQNLHTLLEVALRGRLAARYAASTIDELLASCTDDLRLRGVLLGQHGDYALPPSEASALLHCGMQAHYLKGAHYPIGGGQIISDKLAACIESHGGSIHLRRGIESIVVENGRAVGVISEPSRGVRCEVRARAVLSNADLTRTLLELLGPQHLPRRWRKRVDCFEMAGALFMSYLGLDIDMRELGMRNCNYWVFDDYDFEGAYRRQREDSEAEPFAAYITSASLKDPTTSGHAPAGHTNVEIMTLVAGDPRKWHVQPEQVERWGYKRNEAYRALKQRIEQTLVERLDRQFPGSAEHIVFRESATPLSHSRYTRATGGTGYGLAGTPEQFMHARPGFEGPIDGLFLCGASTRTGHGIVGAMLSGHGSATAVSKSLQRGRS